MPSTPEPTLSVDVWSRLEDGAMLVNADERARVASEYRPETIPPVVDDPASATVLPLLGYRLEATSYPGWAVGPRRSHTWKRPHATGSFIVQLHTTLEAHISSEGMEDGTVRQRLNTADAVAAWHTQRTRLFGASPAPSHLQVIPDEGDMPAHLAYAVHRIPGASWTVTADGLHRVLPAWPLRYAPTPQPLKLELKTKLLVDCLGWAYLPAGSPDNAGDIHELVYLSGVGPQKKLKAAWATVMDHKRDTIKVPGSGSAGRFDLINTRRLEGAKVYETFWNEEPLAESGMAHLVIQHRSLLNPRTGQPFLHLVGADGTPHLSRFAWQLDQASTLPIKPGWAERLWSTGLDAGAIVRLPSYGCAAYWVRPDEESWSELVARCAGATGPVTVERFGVETETVPTVAMVVEERDDDVDDAPKRTLLVTD